MRRLAFMPALLLTVSALAGLAAVAWAEPVPFSCTILPDGKTIRVAISNPFDRDTSCQVNCQFSTRSQGASLQLSCTKTVAAGAKDVQLCVRDPDKETPVKMTGGDGSCIKQLSAAEEKEKDEDDDALIKGLMKQSDEFIKQQREKNPQR